MRREEDNRDVLKEFFDRTTIEKAPEGFTSKVMSHIFMQTRPVKIEKKSLVPWIYAAITALLVFACFFLPEGTMKFPAISIPENLRITFPRVGGNFQISPGILYITAAVILLVIFDYGLKSLFRKEKN